eukprot:TRINITY_DN11184_c0_g1_i2.p1 TRINITY_DN11184_c0_g1~~TRINITY_DN11184_c0_g1_i2.p1  ORF type:complete len:119 (+),score=30.36 TRINITY_DN11184_c0_g1_i2:96-452(+)
MIRRPPRSTLSSSSAASDVYKRQIIQFIVQYKLRIFNSNEKLILIGKKLIPKEAAIDYFNQIEKYYLMKNADFITYSLNELENFIAILDFLKQNLYHCLKEKAQQLQIPESNDSDINN